MLCEGKDAGNERRLWNEDSCAALSIKKYLSDILIISNN